MPGLIPGAIVLAESSGCSRQLIRFTQLAYGLQFHLEMDLSLAQALLAKNKGHSNFHNTKRVFREMEFLKMNDLLFKFLDAFIYIST